MNKFEIEHPSEESKNHDLELLPFLEVLFPNPQEETVKVIAIPEEPNQKRPDYYIPIINTTIELKGLHDIDETKSMAKTGTLFSKLKPQIKNSDRYKDVIGTFIINIPQNIEFSFNPPSRIKEAANQITEAVLRGDTSVSIQKNNFTISKVGDSANGIYMSTMSNARFIDTEKIVFENMGKKLKQVNQQLAFNYSGTSTGRKILLIDNRTSLISNESELIRGLSLCYDDLLTFQDIHEIWFQIRSTNTNKSTHSVVYTKEFMEQYAAGKMVQTDANIELIQSWAFPLRSKDGAHRQRLFSALKGILQERNGHELFKDDYARSEMVQLGEWLLDNNSYDEAVWLIERFINDPDPCIPSTGKESSHDYHKEILEGSNPSTIATVLGNVAWITRKLTTDKEYIGKALEYTAKLLRHENLFIKSASLFPLVEISKRRKWLKGIDEENHSNCFQRFHDETFKLLRTCAKYPAIAKGLSQVFWFYQDITSDEAHEVLDNLKIDDDAATLFIYFPLFRQGHYKDLGPFEDGKLKEQLTGALQDPDDETHNLRGSIIFHLWKLIEEQPREFKTIKPWIDTLLDSPYSRRPFGYVLFIVRDCLETEPEVSLHWMKKYLERHLDFINKKPDQRQMEWLDVDEILAAIAHVNDAFLLELFPLVFRFVEQGVLVTDFEKILVIYRQVKTASVREELKKISLEFYERLSRENPDWKLKPEWD